MKLKYFSICVLTALSFVGNAQISLDSCRVWARKNYPQSQQYDLIERSKEFDITNAARIWIPRIGVSAQGTWQSETMDMGDIFNSGLFGNLGSLMGGNATDLYLRPWQGKVQLDVQQVIWDGGASAAQKKIASEEASLYAAQADVAMKRLEERVDQIFFGILLLEEQSKQINSTMELLQSNLQRATALSQNGVILPSEAETVEAQLLTFQQQQQQLTYGLSAYKKVLGLLCGKDFSTAVLAEPSYNTSQQSVTKPEYETFATQNRLLEAKEEALKVSVRPQLGAFAQGWYGYPKLNMFESMRSGDWGWNAIVGVNLRWDLSAFYSLNDKRQKIRVEQQRVAMQQETFAFNEKLQTEQDDAELARLNEIINSDERIVTLRTSVRQAAEALFENGTLTSSDLLQKVTEETQAKCNMALHKIEYLKVTSKN